MSMDLSQFIPTFLEESFEGLELMESSLLTLEDSDKESINAIFRAAHSIKGGAGTFGFAYITEFTHLVETLLDEIRDGRRELTSFIKELLLESVDCMRILVESARDDSSYDQQKIDSVSAKLSQELQQKSTNEVTENVDGIAEDKEEQDNQSTSWQIEFIPEHHIVQTGNDPLFLFNALADLGTLKVNVICDDLPALMDIDPEELYLSWQLELSSDCSEADIREVFEWVEDECQLNITQLLSVEPESQTDVPTTSPEINQAVDTQPDKPPLPTQKAENPDITKTVKANKNKQDQGSIRVGVDKVDSLINLVGELVITQSMLSELGNDFDMSKLERLGAGLEQLLHNTKELQESVMRIRMLPISFAFNRFPRLIHDLSRKTGKEINLVIRGEHTELDKTVMEQIGDPLVHLVRNAIDHGIEPAEVRKEKGKPEIGTVILDAYHHGGSIVIEISDDGGGIDKQAVLNKALDKGVIDESANLSDSQIYDLIFEAGFSTAKEVSDISGRGVGMDVVRKNIQALGGRIQIESTKDQGSTFRVNLPLTLAIVDGQLVRVGSETYIVPLISIVESLQVNAANIKKVSGDMVVYRLREDNVPVLPIYQLFSIDSNYRKIDNSLLVVVESDGMKVGLMVDDLLAQQQVVIKSLADNYQQVGGISGATILGDGSVALILDIPGMIEMAMKNPSCLLASSEVS